MTQTSGVPSWGTSMTYSQHTPTVTCALGVPSSQAGTSSTTLAQGFA